MNKRTRKTEVRANALSGSDDGTVTSEQRVRADDVIAELRKRNSVLEQANRELECMAEYRSRFLVRLAHELRNPLTSILGFAEILLNHEKLTEAQQDFCQKIQNSALQIEASLIQLSDLARLRPGHAALSLEEFSLADVLRESSAVVARQAHQQETLLDFQAADGLPAIVSDRSKLRQVLYNFLAFAIGRSPEGTSVKVTAGKRGGHFVVTIEDEGSPMPEFDKMFAAAESVSMNQSMATNDLGLAIARQLLDALGGQLRFHQRPPRGLKLEIELPQRPADATGPSVVGDQRR
jgi:signal transduction histidine kinase